MGVLIKRGPRCGVYIGVTDVWKLPATRLRLRWTVIEWGQPKYTLKAKWLQILGYWATFNELWATLEQRGQLF